MILDTDPVWERVAEIVTTRINRASRGAGFNLNHSAIRDGDVRPPATEVLSVVGLGRAKDTESEDAGLTEWALYLEVVIEVQQSDESTTPIDRLKSLAAADVLKAVMADRQFENNAITTRPFRMEFDVQSEDTTLGYAVVTFEIHLRHLDTDPSRIGG